MLSFLYVLQFIISILLILVVMFQKSEGGTSLISSNSYNSFFSSKALVSNPLTRITIILGFVLFVNSIIIGGIHIRSNSQDNGLLDTIEKLQQEKINKSETRSEKTDSIPKAPLGNK